MNVSEKGFLIKVSASAMIGLALTWSVTASASLKSDSSVAEIKKVAEAISKTRRKPIKGLKVKSHVGSNLIPAKRRVKKGRPLTTFAPVDSRPFFDLPVTYNSKVKTWINYFQNRGKRWYKKWLERSHRYLPHMQAHLKKKGLPQDLAYVAMIESGFSPHAISHAEAVGYWQFIKSTANRYGLKTAWWIDERRDFAKSTDAAANYLADLYGMFDSWYLTASAYNMGEGRMKRLIKKYKTKNFWVLSKKPDFPKETRNYIPKLLAALLIAKAPKLYGFNDIEPLQPYSYEYFHVPGGTDLHSMADYLGVEKARLKRLNPDLLKGFVPSSVKTHKIRIPAGLTAKVSQYIRKQL